MININKRSFTFGLGTGIILITFITFFVYSFDYKQTMINKENKTAKLSDEDIITEAKKLGMIFVSELPQQNVTEKNEEESLQETNKEETTEESLQETNKEKTTEENLQETNKEETTEENLQEASTETEKKEEPSEVENAPYVEIDISEGLASYDITKILYENKIIDDQKQFEDYLTEKGISKKLFYGKFKFQKNMEYEDIIKIISKI